MMGKGAKHTERFRGNDVSIVGQKGAGPRSGRITVERQPRGTSAV
jgi:hypothetical protein